MSGASSLAKSSQDVVMPRMVYDIWPYFVPFYPLYSNVLYPLVNNIPTVTTGNATSFSSGTTALTPTYYRPIRTNPASVNFLFFSSTFKYKNKGKKCMKNSI